MLQIGLMLAGQAFAYQLNTFLDLGESPDARLGADPEASALYAVLQAAKKCYEIVGKISDVETGMTLSNESESDQLEIQVTDIDVRESAVQLLKAPEFSASLRTFAVYLIDSMGKSISAFEKASKGLSSREKSWKTGFGEESSWEDVRKAASKTIDEIDGVQTKKSVDELQEALFQFVVFAFFILLILFKCVSLCSSVLGPGDYYFWHDIMLWL